MSIYARDSRSSRRDASVFRYLAKGDDQSRVARTDTEVCVDGREKGGANAVHVVLLVWYVRACPWIAVFLREAEIDDLNSCQEPTRAEGYNTHIDKVRCLPGTHHKICGLNVAVNEVVRVYELYARELPRTASVEVERLKGEPLTN